MAPLVSEVAIPEPEIEIEAPAKHDLTSTAEESPAVVMSEPETPYAIEETPAAVDHSLLAESGSHDDENVVDKSETVELHSEVEPKPAEEAKIDEETAGVAAVATSIAVASAAVVMTNELSTAQPSLVEAVTTKAKVDHSADIPAIEAISSTRIVATESVVPSSEPTVNHDDIPVSTTVGPDVVSSLEATKVETEPLEFENLVERTAIEPGEIVGEETEGHVEVEPSPATQAVPTSVTDVAPITAEAITEVRETVGVLAQVT